MTLPAIDPEKEKQLREALQKERDHIFESARHASSESAKIICTFAVALLAWSITFIDKIAPAPTWCWAINISWALFSISICSELVSHHLSQHAILRHSEIVNLQYRKALRNETIGEADKRNTWNTWVKSTNAITQLAFVAGLFSMVIFAAHNFPTKTAPSPQSPPRVQVDLIVPSTLDVNIIKEKP